VHGQVLNVDGGEHGKAVWMKKEVGYCVD